MFHFRDAWIGSGLTRGDELLMAYWRLVWASIHPWRCPWVMALFRCCVGLWVYVFWMNCWLRNYYVFVRFWLFCRFMLCNFRSLVFCAGAVLIVLGLGFFRNRIPLACAEGKWIRSWICVADEAVDLDRIGMKSLDVFIGWKIIRHK